MLNQHHLNLYLLNTRQNRHLSSRSLINQLHRNRAHRPQFRNAEDTYRSVRHSWVNQCVLPCYAALLTNVEGISCQGCLHPAWCHNYERIKFEFYSTTPGSHNRLQVSSKVQPYSDRLLSHLHYCRVIALGRKFSQFICSLVWLIIVIPILFSG